MLHKQLLIRRSGCCTARRAALIAARPLRLWLQCEQPRTSTSNPPRPAQAEWAKPRRCVASSALLMQNSSPLNWILRSSSISTLLTCHVPGKRACMFAFGVFGCEIQLKAVVVLVRCRVIHDNSVQRLIIFSRQARLCGGEGVSIDESEASSIFSHKSPDGTGGNRGPIAAMGRSTIGR